jgi:4'-phosphopantetheinyl transferase
MSAPAAQAQFLAGRFVARMLLSTVHGGHPLRDWPLGADACAPAHLLPGARLSAAAVCISISHSAGHVACAVDAAPVGIDVESTRRRNLDRLIGAACTPAEQTEMASLEPAPREQRFYVAWTLKEAWVKQRGEGISAQRLASLDTSRARPDEPADAWSWRLGAAVLSMAARAAPQSCFGDAGELDDAQAWRVRERLTLP